MNYREFFERKAETVAQDLVGKILLRITPKWAFSGTIIETSAYEGGKPTKARRGMFYAPGSIFLMSFRGFNLLNIATQEAGYASCVEIRQLATLDKVIKGPGAISRALEISQDFDGIFLGEEVQILDNPFEEKKVKKIEGKSDNCFGYFTLVEELRRKND